MTESQEWADWEPRSPAAWRDLDPLAQLDNRENSDELGRIADAAAAGYLRLPAPLRRQSWREREIFASLWTNRSIVAPALVETSWLGVGRRRINGQRMLAAIVTTDVMLPPDPLDASAAYGLPAELEAPSRIPGIDGTAVRAGPTVPVVLEQTAGPVHYRVVPPEYWSITSRGVALGDVTPMQSGDEIAGQDGWGARSPGTLTAFVSLEDQEQPLMLSVAHVMGQRGRKVIAYRGGTRVAGKVIMSDCRLDAAIAEPTEPWHVDYRLRAADEVPGRPVPATSDMPVQMWGARSKHQQGRVHQALVVPAGAGAIGMLVPFTATIPAAPGDSGALIVAGPGPFPGVPAASAPGTRDPLNGSMLGMLLAGPNPRNPGATQEVWAVPLTEILELFRVQVWVRE
jgi:hypothetical protein